MRVFRPEKWYREPKRDDGSASQGDQLFGLTIGVATRSKESSGDYDVVKYRGDFIVVTQSCDLEQRKVSRVEVAPIHPLSRWLYFNPGVLNDLDSIRSGETHRFYLLPGWPGAPFEQVRLARIVAFDQQFSISWDELEASRAGNRLGLRSPYIEHFGQAVARFYMRVGLPEDMPPVIPKPDPPQQTPERRTVTNERIVALDARQMGDKVGDLPVLKASLPVLVQKMGFPGHPDLLYKARIDRHGTFFGVGTDAESAVDSLARRLVLSQLESGRGLSEEDAAWLQTAFRSPD